MKTVKIGNSLIGEGQPVYIVAEIGINHNGSLKTAKRLIDAAVSSGCNAVKFQKRTPELCVPKEQQGVIRETPWGLMNYMEYRRRIEFNRKEYQIIDSYCKERNITWFASVWDVESLKFIEQFNPPCIKIPSPLLTNYELVKACALTNRSVILSTGMSEFDEIRNSVKLLKKTNYILVHSTSIYPCPIELLNLKMINTLKKEFKVVVGYSGHEVGLSPTYAAVALGAVFVERHITLDRAMWGTDQAASVEPGGFRRLVENIRNIEDALGDGIKKVYKEELVVKKRLRGLYSKEIAQEKQC